VELRHVSMHGGKGRPHPLWDGSCGRMKEGRKRGRRDRQGWCIREKRGKEGKRADRRGKREKGEEGGGKKITIKICL